MNNVDTGGIGTLIKSSRGYRGSAPQNRAYKKKKNKKILNITIIVYLAHMELYQDFEKKPNYRTLPVKDVEELIKYISRWLDGKTQVEVNEQGNYVIKIEMPPLKQT